MRYDKILKIRIDERLLKILRHNLSKRNNMTRRSISMSEYIRNLILKDNFDQLTFGVDKEAYGEIMRVLSGMGNNLNQITYSMNRGLFKEEYICEIKRITEVLCDMQEKTQDLYISTKSGLGVIATYDMSDLEDSLEELLTADEKSKMSLEERIDFCRALRPFIEKNYLQIIRQSEKYAEKWERDNLTEKGRTILTSEIINTIRRELIQENMNVNKVILNTIHKIMKTETLSVETRVTLIEEMYPEVLKIYREEYDIEKQVTKSVEHLINYMTENGIEN